LQQSQYTLHLFGEVFIGEDTLGRKGADTVRISWTDIAAISPEISIVLPCGFGVEEAVE
jgi:hypothetical protein